MEFAVPQSNLFPFLIGTIKTQFLEYLEREYRLFPFLIGTIKTNDSSRTWNVSLLVSIPYRYDKNAIDVPLV